MALGAVLHPSARVNEGLKRTQRVRDQERERDRETEDRDMGSILVDYQTEETRDKSTTTYTMSGERDISGQVRNQGLYV